jgi:phosphoglycolate phosphatase-like HAD superfamily hydrolase
VRIYAAAKPRAAGIRLAVENLRVVAGPSVFYIGDSASDAIAAKRAMVSFAWASYGYCNTKPPETDAVLGTFADVLNL